MTSIGTRLMHKIESQLLYSFAPDSWEYKALSLTIEYRSLENLQDSQTHTEILDKMLKLFNEREFNESVVYDESF